MKRFLLRAKEYFRENLGAPFVIGFQILLLTCAGLLVIGNSALANDLAVAAYFSLVIGVVLQFVSFLKHGENEQGKNER
jgi:heme/copper-type cytochrome/quinol oxidase subunit 4